MVSLLEPLLKHGQPSKLCTHFCAEVPNIWDNYTLVDGDSYVLEAHTDDLEDVNEYNVVAITPPSAYWFIPTWSGGELKDDDGIIIME